MNGREPIRGLVALFRLRLAGAMDEMPTDHVLMCHFLSDLSYYRCSSSFVNALYPISYWWTAAALPVGGS